MKTINGKMFFIIAEYIQSKLNINLYRNVIRVAKIMPDIEFGIEEEKYEYNIRIPECYSSQDELDNLV